MSKSVAKTTQEPEVQQAVPGLAVPLRKSIERIETDDGATLAAVRKAPLGSAKGAVLTIHGFGQNRYSFHLPNFSLTTWLVHQGFESWNLDLRGHGRSRPTSPHPQSADEYIQRDYPATVRTIRARTGLPLFAVGHSLGGAVLYGGTPYVADELAGLIPVGAVYDFGGRQPLFRLGGFFLDRVPGLRQLTRLPLPIDLAGRAVDRLLPWIDHPVSAAVPFNIWHPRTIERRQLKRRVTAGFDRTSLGVLRHMLRWAATRSFDSDDRSIDYAARWRRLGDVPLLVIAGSRDTLLPPSDAKAGYRDSPAEDKQFRVFSETEGGRPWGHTDLLQGRRAPTFVWPEMLAWMEARL